MRELSLNILDITQNSISAGAKNIVISVNAKDNFLTISIEDDGKGMTKEFLSKVTDPFTTTRTTRRVGMGLPFLRQEAEAAGGGLQIESEPGKGTKVTAKFLIDSIDRLPMGDLAETIASLILTSPDIDYTLRYSVENRSYVFETSEFRKLLDGIPIGSPEIVTYIKELLTENIKEVNGGISL
jgi:anti-sigma regulatory factor (Ser/Thr protein kinase)